MKHTIILIGILCVLSGIAVVSAAEQVAFQGIMDGTGWTPSPTSTQLQSVVSASADSITITMFYSHTCTDCQRVLTGFLPQFLVQHPEVRVQYYDNADNPANKALFASYNERYNRPGSPVPAIFVGDRELVGYEEITTGLEAAVREAAAHMGSEDLPTASEIVTPLPETGTFGTFTDQFPAEVFGQTPAAPVAAWTPLPDSTRVPSYDETRTDSADYVSSFAFLDFVVPAASDLAPASSSIIAPFSRPEDTGRNTAFTIPFAFPDFTPAPPDNSQPSPAAASTGIRLSDGSLLAPFGIPDTEVVTPSSGCQACG